METPGKRFGETSSPPSSFRQVTITGAEQAVEKAVHRDRRPEALGHAVHLPFEVRFGDVALAGRVHGDAGAAAAAVDVDHAAGVDRRHGVARTPGTTTAPCRRPDRRLAGRSDAATSSCVLPLISASVGVLWVKPDFGPLLLPFEIAGLAIERQQPRVLVVLVALQQHHVAVQHRAAADGHVEGVGRDFLAPDEFAVVVERGQDGRAEQDVDAVGVGGRRRRRVAAAQVGELPRPRLRPSRPRAACRRRPCSRRRDARDTPSASTPAGQKLMVTKTRPPCTIGLDWLWSCLFLPSAPGSGCFHRTFSSSLPPQVNGRSFSSLMPMPVGPRQPGQSAGRRGRRREQCSDDQHAGQRNSCH